MSYIVPREKPNRCTNCIYMDRITYDCKLMYGDDYPDFESQYKNCPLVEIPTPHGRLVDIKSVEDRKFTTVDNEYERWWNGALDSVVDNAPTVIEAEGSEE